ncbi:MAG: pyrroloquinoline quinone biosynthesis peptide chaperone PqqD [Pseudomonadota bacterium]
MRISATTIPSLPRGVRLKHCAVRDQWFLLSPERALTLDQTGLAILKAVDGERDFEAIAALLDTKFTGAREVITADMSDFLGQLAEQRIVDLA